MISKSQIEATVRLLEEGCTIPFIARYRKEVTGGLDEVEIEEIRKEDLRKKELEKRKQTVLSTIEEQGKLTAELKKRIVECDDLQILEDIYLPYKPKRRTKAAIAKENGLEPLADWLMKEQNGDVFREAARFVKNDVKSEDDALAGARDIIAEVVNENEIARSTIRHEFQRYASVKTKVARDKETEGIKYKDYFEFEEPLHRSPCCGEIGKPFYQKEYGCQRSNRIGYKR